MQTTVYYEVVPVQDIFVLFLRLFADSILRNISSQTHHLLRCFSLPN